MSAEKKVYKMTAKRFLSEPEPAQDPVKDKPVRKRRPARKPEQIEVPEGYMLTREYKTERMQLLIRPTLKKGIKKAADLQGISMNDLINELIEEYLERQDK